MRQRTLILLAALLLAALALPPPALATNGLFLVGYGAETTGRAGANLAVSDRTLALNSNPAGLSQLQGRHYSMNLSILAPTLESGNAINSSVDAEDRLFPLPAVAYIRSPHDSKWAWGWGLVAQGGMGATFKNQNTFFGTRDETYTEVRFVTLTPAVSYALTEDMSVGATLNAGWADASFRFFPRTSFFNSQAPQNSFFGVDMKRAGGPQASLRLGWSWRARPDLSFGAIYQTRTWSNFENGDMVVNFNAHPMLGRKVSYDAEMKGFNFAAQAGAGVAWRPSPDWVLALDVKRYFWDSAMNTITVTAKNPSVQGAPPEIVLPFVFNWRDQWVYAVGADYRLSPSLTVRAGYNYGENPVPDATLTPLFPAITDKHASLGFAWTSGKRTYDFAIERAFPKRQVNNNTDPRVNPFGPGAWVDHEQWTLSVGASWALDIQK
jgi:long-chain fatty acid transport protein